MSLRLASLRALHCGHTREHDDVIRGPEPALVLAKGGHVGAVVSTAPTCPPLAKARAQAFAARRPLAESKRGAGRACGAGSPYLRQRKSRATGPTVTTVFRPSA